MNEYRNLQKLDNGKKLRILLVIHGLDKYANSTIYLKQSTKLFKYILHIKLRKCKKNGNHLIYLK